MSYKRAEQVLPEEIIALIQNYIDGEYLYIPRKENNRKQWGASTSTRYELEMRNQQIFKDYQDGLTNGELAKKYFLSEKSIQRIVRQMKYVA